MRAAAILGPGVAAKCLGTFQAAGVDLAIVDSPRPGYDCVLLFGGDGTVHRHLPALLKTDAPLLVVPTGSGNDFARALGLGTRESALAAWRRFCAGENNVRRIDVGIITDHCPLATDHYFVCVAGAGLDAAVNRLANRLPRWLRGTGGYILALPPALFRFRPQHFTVVTPDGAAADSVRRFSEPAMMAAFGNAPSYGHGMRIAPRADLADGKLDVCVVRRLGKLRLLRLFPTVLSGAHLAIPEVEYFQATAVRLDTETPLEIYADGEFVCRTPAEIRVLPRRLSVIAP